MLFWGLALVSLPFILPIVSLVRSSRTRMAVRLLEERVAEQDRSIARLARQLEDLKRAAPLSPPPSREAAAPAIPLPQAATPQPAPAQLPAPVFTPPVTRTPEVPRPSPPPRPAPIVEPAGFAARSTDTTGDRDDTTTDIPERSLWPSFTLPKFDWENLVGVKLFSGIAGIALVIAAVFFLRYSVEHGWLEPPVRVVIGILVALGLLTACELKAARRYPVTANALDAAAVAILFATFFAAHSLWHLISAGVAFALLALVTAVAVVLSIRRDSLFIAVLGLLGGFATPALLSTGENRPIPLFAYLLLLNVGLAWVAYRKRWAALSTLTVVLTAAYQWGWVFRFLSASQLSLAAGIFLLFPLVAVVSLTIGRRAPAGADADMSENTFEATALGAAVLPLLFAAYIATVPAYGESTGILFGLLLLVDCGLLAIALARGQEFLHAVGAVGTVLVFALWLSQSYGSGSYTVPLGFLPLFVSLYAFAPLLAARLTRPFLKDARHAVYAAPLVLVAFVVFAGTPQAAAFPLPLFGVLVALVALLAWRALEAVDGPLYFLAAFFAVAAQAVWSIHFLSAGRLIAAILIYTAFGVLSIGVPVTARLRQRWLEPRWGSGALLLASLALLLFIATGPVSPSALWGLAFLIAVLDASMFVEAAAETLPLVSFAGGVLSWIVLGVWWWHSAGAIGLLPSLLVVLLVTLVMLAGYAWSYMQATSVDRAALPPTIVEAFLNGIYLAMGGHLFLMFIAARQTWSIPPWPLFGALTVMTLAVSITALRTRVHALHVAGVACAMIVVLFWTSAAVMPPWTWVALIAAACVAAYALIWIRVSARFNGVQMTRIGAGTALFLFEAVALNVALSSGAPRVEVFVAAHMIGLGAILALSWRARWNHVAAMAVIPAGLAVSGWHTMHPQPDAWLQLLMLTAGIYAVFLAYPFVLGARARDSRDPYVAAVLASGVFFFGARQAFLQGGLGPMVGAVPVLEAVILALLLRQLLRIQQTGARDLGRLALVAGASLAFVTVAIPLQLHQQWVTIGWALEGAALAWAYTRIPHRGLLYSAAGLLGAVFVRLALNPEIFRYEPRGALRIWNWYLYAYVICACAFFLAAWFLSRTDDRIGARAWRLSHAAPAAGVILLFIVLNIEIADFYATGPEIMFRFGVTLAQDLTYTIGWLAFGILLMTAAIYLRTHAGRIAALALIAVTTFKCFLYDLGSLGGLYRIGSLVGLAVALTLVSLALQKFVLHAPKESE